jgi:hypothetical protein
MLKFSFDLSLHNPLILISTIFFWICYLEDELDEVDGTAYDEVVTFIILLFFFIFSELL